MEATPRRTRPKTRPMARRAVRWVRVRVSSAYGVWGRGFRRLAESHSFGVAGDSLVAVALAGTLFFSVPSTEARENVALYLLLTLAPFAVLGPVLGRLYQRAPGAYRGGLVVSSAGRAVVAVGALLAGDGLLLFPLVFTLLVLSRFHGISRASVLPAVVRDAAELVDANARLARLGLLAGAAAVPLGVVAVASLGAGVALGLAAIAYVLGAVVSAQLPAVRVAPSRRTARRGRVPLPRRVRLARFATAAVRFLNGYLLLLVAFAFRDGGVAVLSLSALLAAAGVGYYLSASAAPRLGSFITEEPMVVAALAVEAGAAFIAAQAFSLLAGVVLAAAAGFAWGMAKFGFDGLLQTALPDGARGRAFTVAETMFQMAWVVGALIPVLPFLPAEPGLAGAGLLALAIQVVYVTLVLLPEAARWRGSEVSSPGDGGEEERGVLDLL